MPAPPARRRPAPGAHGSPTCPRPGIVWLPPGHWPRPRLTRPPPAAPAPGEPARPQSDGMPRPRTSRPRLSSLGRMNTLASWGEHLARALLRDSLPRRWAHVQGVAARARGLAPVLGADADLLQAAAWLHDIGYAPSLADTGLRARDGARHLRDTQRAGTMPCRLDAQHSYAILEAEERGLADVL